MPKSTVPLFESNISGLELINRGKVRDIYAVEDEHLLIIASDRLSAFDVVLPDPIPGKGEVLTTLTNFWFDHVGHFVRSHRSKLRLEEVVTDPDERRRLGGRATVARRLKPLPIEAIVRGYLIGSGWKDYQSSGEVCGIALPIGLRQADRLPETIFTPSTKAEIGAHDENISYARAVSLIGERTAAQVREVSLRIYAAAAAHAGQRGIIVADTKLEFALDDDGELVLIDEVVTPDSSRFWSRTEYRPGVSPPSFDKQFVRDYLEAQGWNKRPPAPVLPAEVISRTAEKYAEARDRLIS